MHWGRYWCGNLTVAYFFKVAPAIVKLYVLVEHEQHTTRDQHMLLNH